jgi:hypothetical protein
MEQNDKLSILTRAILEVERPLKPNALTILKVERPLKPDDFTILKVERPQELDILTILKVERPLLYPNNDGWEPIILNPNLLVDG